MDRVIFETDDSCVTTEFHPRATVVYGLDRPTGRRLATDLTRALCGDVDRMHVEVAVEGRELAVFRPAGHPHRVIDVSTSTDVTASFRDGDGRVDLLAACGIGPDRAGTAMHLAGPETDGPAPTGSEGRLRPVAMAVAAVALTSAALVAQRAVEIAACLAVAAVALAVGVIAGRRRFEPCDGAVTVGGHIRAVQDSTGLADPLPVVVTDLFESLPPHQKAAALDAAIRAGEGGQVVIVTDDRDVVDLARFREMAGEVTVVTPTVHDVTEAAGA